MWKAELGLVSTCAIEWEKAMMGRKGRWRNLRVALILVSRYMLIYKAVAAVALALALALGTLDRGSITFFWATLVHTQARHAHTHNVQHLHNLTLTPMGAVDKLTTVDLFRIVILRPLQVLLVFLFHRPHHYLKTEFISIAHAQCHAHTTWFDFRS